MKSTIVVGIDNGGSDRIDDIYLGSMRRMAEEKANCMHNFW